MTSTTAHISEIATAVPAHEVHGLFMDWALPRIADSRAAALFQRMAARSGIRRRWSVIEDAGRFYAGETLPSTAARMAIYAEAAPALALDAAQRLDTRGVTHLVVASCTGFVAPGIDQILAARLDLSPAVERTLIGFMGCYAAVAALRTAHHIVRSDPQARVLVVTVELSTLHLQPTGEVEPLLAMLQFADGAAAAIVSANPEGIAISGFFADQLPESGDMIRWTIGNHGFAMHLSGAVPGRIGAALREGPLGEKLRDADAWAIHPGGRSILDSVQQALDLPPDALAASRAVLAEHGNMSSATLMFVLRAMLDGASTRNGVAIAFGPGVAAEGFRFRHVR